MNTETGWMDISTAPRDGTEILVGCYEDKLYVGHDRPEAPERIWTSTVAFGFEDAKPWETPWRLTQTGSYAGDNDLNAEPTHWHPLPLQPPLP